MELNKYWQLKSVHNVYWSISTLLLSTGKNILLFNREKQTHTFLVCPSNTHIPYYRKVLSKEEVQCAGVSRLPVTPVIVNSTVQNNHFILCTLS